MSEPHASPHEMRQPAAPRRRRWWVHVLLSLVIFASGGAVGVGATLIVLRNRVLYAIHHPREMPVRIAAGMRRPLQLSDEQVRQVQQILSQRQQVLQNIRRRVQPEVEAELDRVEQQVAEVLDNQQREWWREYFAHLRGTWLPPLPTEP
jgi:shikimate kinase